MEWTDEEYFASARATHHVILQVERVSEQPERWVSETYISAQMRKGNNVNFPLLSMEEAKDAAEADLLKHLTELAAELGYKLVKEQA